MRELIRERWVNPDYKERVRASMVAASSTPERMATYSENMKGEKNPRAKLTLAKAREIKTLIADGMLNKRIAERVGASVKCVKDIRAGLTWKHA